MANFLKEIVRTYTQRQRNAATRRRKRTPRTYLIVQVFSLGSTVPQWEKRVSEVGVLQFQILLAARFERCSPPLSHGCKACVGMIHREFLLGGCSSSCHVCSILIVCCFRFRCYCCAVSDDVIVVWGGLLHLRHICEAFGMRKAGRKAELLARVSQWQREHT